jgi:16S rRNA C1402 N4-methylase RsmH
MLRHIPVLAKEIVETLPKKLTTYFDGTFGH